MNSVVNKALISEIALRCADTNFKDFDYNIYEQALLRADREIAKKYQILTKIYSDNIPVKTEVELVLPNFKAEYLVVCGEQTLKKVTHKIEDTMEYCYYLEVIDEKLKFAYKLDNIIELTTEEVTNNDNEITILYTIIPDKETYTSNDYVIDSMYDEERINHALRYIIQLGIAKFVADKKQKYMDLYRILMTNNDYDKRVIKDNAWVSMRPFNYI